MTFNLMICRYLLHSFTAATGLQTNVANPNRIDSYVYYEVYMSTHSVYTCNAHFKSQTSIPISVL